MTIDFKDPGKPVINKVDFDFDECGHSLCIVDTKGDHTDLTDEYAAVRIEMESIARHFGKDTLRDVDKDVFFNKISELRKAEGDRAVLRAIHFFADNQRVEKEVNALNSGDFESFKEYVIDSGNSSYMYNQNVYLGSTPKQQPMSIALALSETILKGKGAWRVHGGGFAGTIQAFVPDDLLGIYIQTLEGVFGEGSCHVLSIRQAGGTIVLS